MQLEKVSKIKFEETIRLYIKRDGIENLIEYLGKSDFYTAPASRMYHSDYKGGLCDHSYTVFRELQNECNSDFTDETIAIVGLFHDICKVGYYGTEMRNTKNDKGQWVKKPYYTIDDKLPLGHGEKSIIMLLSFIKLTVEEMMAIRWHMGGYEPKENWGASSRAYSEFPLAVLVHCADMKATYIEETRGKK